MRLLGAAVVSIAAGALMAAVAGAQDEPWRARVSEAVLNLYGATTAPKATLKAQSSSLGARNPSRARYDAAGRLHVDVTFDCAQPSPVRALRQVGFVVGTTLTARPVCILEGWADLRKLPQIAGTAGVTRVDLPHYALHRHPLAAPLQPSPSAAPAAPPSGRRGTASPQGSGGQAIDGEGVALMQVTQFTEKTSITGAGVKLAIISDDATSVATIQGRGELPASVTIVLPSANPAPHSTLTDEGTMMLEEAYAVAPGASLYFCGPETDVEYVSCLQALAADGVAIVSDDLTFPGEDMMSAESALAQGVASVLSSNPGMSLFTVTGNYNGSYWQRAYAPISSGATSISCPTNGQVDAYVESFAGAQYEGLAVAAAVPGIPLVIQWADPFDQNASNFDLYFVDTSYNGGTGVCVPLGGSTATIFETTLDDLENAITGTSNGINPNDSYAILIGTPDTSLAGKEIKLLVAGDGATTLSASTGGSVTSPQAFVASVNTIGAVDGADAVGDTIEPFSGVGPLTLLFPTATSTQAPLVVAPDGIYVDASGTNFASLTATGSLFYGTSAASPNAASVAALLLSAFPTLTPAELTQALESGASMLGSATPNATFGYGRVNAVGALAAITPPSVSGFTSASIVGGSSSGPLAFNVGGTGALTVSVTPASLIPSGSSGLQISPAGCGSSGPATCSVVLTPSLGQAGSTTVTVAVTDGAQRSASYQASVTVTKPAPPTINITAGGSQTLDPSAALAPITLTVAGTGPLSVSLAGGNGTVMLTSGCGSTVMTCTATGMASAAAGSSSIVFTVKDSWSQSTGTTASITVAVPADKGGGGSMDGEVLALASILVALRALALRMQRARAAQPR